MPRPFRLLPLLALLLLVAVPAAAAAPARLPTVGKITPRKVQVGADLTILGKNFLPGRNRNTVVFQADRKQAVFIKARAATKRKLTVTIPQTVAPFLRRASGTARPTVFAIRVLSRRFGLKFTSGRLAPTILPSPAGPAGPTPCDPLAGDRAPAGDADNDGLTNGIEKQIGTNVCLGDTDGDTMSDYWEYWSAMDYNGRPSRGLDGACTFESKFSRCSPGKRPYTNPLDPSDAGVDHDGDGLPAAAEYAAWAKWGTKNDEGNLFLSDGTQNSLEFADVPGMVQYGEFRRVPAPRRPTSANPWLLDTNGDGWLSDDERDSDLGDPTGLVGDGLGNWDELAGRMTPEWWAKKYPNETPYGLSKFEKTDWLDPDTDGDGVRDGRDDVDHDGWANWREIDRFHANFEPSQERTPDAVGDFGYMTNPFNPCLPDYTGRKFPDRPLDGASPRETCSNYVPFEDPWAPFKWMQASVEAGDCDGRNPDDPADARFFPPFRFYPNVDTQAEPDPANPQPMPAYCPVPSIPPPR